MKFIFTTRESYQEPGARIRCYNFSERLRRKGINASVFSFVEQLGAKSGKDETDFRLRDKLRCVYGGVRAVSKKTNENVFIVNRFNYHAIPVWLVSQIKKIPFIFDMDDWEAREDIGFRFSGFILKSKAEYLTRLFAGGSLFCIAASLYLKDYLSQFNKKVYYLPTGVDIEKFALQSYKEKKDFIFSWHGSVNRIEVIDYIQFIIECFLAVQKKYPLIKLFIAGDGIFGRQLERLIAKYNCRQIVHNKINHEDVPQYLNGVDAGLVPLLDKTHFNLSKSPVKLFEYMAKAKPVIASSVGEANSIIKNGNNGLLASGRNQFISSMEKLINNPDLVKNMGINAHKTVKNNYSLNVLAERLYGIFLSNFPAK